MLCKAICIQPRPFGRPARTTIVNKMAGMSVTVSDFMRYASGGIDNRTHWQCQSLTFVHTMSNIESEFMGVEDSPLLVAVEAAIYL